MAWEPLRNHEAQTNYQSQTTPPQPGPLTRSAKPTCAEEESKHQMQTTSLEIRIHIQGGPVEGFFQNDPATATRILEGLHPAKLFTTNKITIAGEYSLTAFNPSRITRIDFLKEDFALWEFPTGIMDVVELSEEEFRQRTHLNDPAHQERREDPKPPGEFAVLFLDAEMAGGERIFLAVEVMSPLPAERLQRLHLCLSSPALHFRLRQGGAAVLNLANLVRFTILPGPDRAPADAWPAHHAAGL
jgi:hypothetical protein